MTDVSHSMAWLSDRPSEEAVTGFDAGGWPASTWVLHAMYENPALIGVGTHDDLRRQRIDAGEVEPLIIGDVRLDAATTVIGTPLGFVVRPGRPWGRIHWADYLQRFPEFTPRYDVPPCDHWFPGSSWPIAVEPPPEGSLDGESLEALVAVLAAHAPEGEDTPCFAFYASLPAGDFDTTHLWTGPLKHVRQLVDEYGGPYSFSPTNIWPVSRDWFVWTDYDLQGTKVSGGPDLIKALYDDPRLECHVGASPATVPVGR